MILRWLISKLKRKPKQGELVSEQWQSRFTHPKKARFKTEEGEKHRVRIERGYLSLELNSANLFAWSLNPRYRYRNFVMDLSFSFGSENGHSAGGALFRYVSEENYYYALLSNRGYFRFDVVFNGNPIPLIPWMKVEVPEPEETDEFGEITLRIIAHETAFAFFVNGEWIAELNDEMIDAGYVAFAGQNYGEGDAARFYLYNFLIETRAVEVEVLYQRWVNYLEPEAERRYSLARRLYEMEQYAAALIQVKKACKSRDPNGEERFFLAEILIGLGMYEDALAQVEKSLEIKPDFREAQIEKANILYLLNRFLDAKEWIEGIIKNFPDHAPLHNLLGNTEFSLGKWESAAQWYEKSIDIEPDMPIIMLNAARAHDNGENRDRAVDLYRRAAEGFFRQEAYEEIPPVLSRMGEIEPEDPVMASLEGKIRFQEGNLPEAERIFIKQIEAGSAESDIHFLEGIIKMQRGAPGEAAGFFRTAVDLEPDFHLYRLRLAESLHLAGFPADAKEELEKAVELMPDDGWTCNLAGLIALEGGENEKALAYLEKAYKALPEEREVQLNYSTVLFRLKGIETAEAVLTLEKDPYILNHRGNLHTDSGDPEGGVEFYRRALEFLPEEPAFLENMAGALLKAGRPVEAEEYVVRLLDTGEESSPGAYGIIAEVAQQKGEFERAAAALEHALELEPEVPGMRLSLLRLLTRRNNWEKAKEHLDLLETHTPEEALSPSERDKVSEFRQQVKRALEIHYECSSCGREWWVPKNAEMPEKVRLYGELPDESPAGKCETCGRVYCIGCARNHMRDGRFVCPHCEVNLKLSEGGLKYLAVEYAKPTDENP
ncbi:MAG: tetratricopeptide repeat protein [Spirochaetaceae bacterium]